MRLIDAPAFFSMKQRNHSLKKLIFIQTACVRHEKKLTDMKRFNMKRFVKKNQKKKHNLICLISQSYGFQFERESGRDYSLELRELVLAFEDMITTFTTLLYFHSW